MTTCKLSNTKLTLNGTAKEIEKYLIDMGEFYEYHYSASKDEFIPISTMNPEHWKNAYLKQLERVIESLRKESPESIAKSNIILDYCVLSVSDDLVKELDAFNSYIHNLN